MTATIRDSVLVVNNKKVSKLASKMGFPAREVRMDAKSLVSLLTLRENVQREYKLLKDRYAPVGLEELISTVAILKKNEEEPLRTEEEKINLPSEDEI